MHAGSNAYYDEGNNPWTSSLAERKPAGKHEFGRTASIVGTAVW